MKILLTVITMVLLSCNETNTTSDKTDSDDTIIVREKIEKTVESPKPPPPPPASTKPEVYFNERFKDVTVQKTGENKYTIEGKGQIFEANFSYVVEDGHEELKKGHQMTDAGAPEWGKFKFTIDVPKKRPNSTLTLILFEISAEDGRRVHELPIPLG